MTVTVYDPTGSVTLIHSAPPSVATTGSLSISLDFGGGKVAHFAQSSAIDKGDFVGEFVHQKCLLALDPAFPDWRVFFRPDANGKRDEVVVEYGRSTHGTPVHITTPYTATIMKGGAIVYKTTIPQHFWYSRWRYQSAPRPVVRTPATLKSRKWVPNFGSAGMFGKAALTTAIAWPGPFVAFADASFNTDWGSTGDQWGIGHLTEYAADYMIHSNASSLTSLMTEGEWIAGNAPMCSRDDTTGAPLDVRGQSLNNKSNGGTINEPPGSASNAFIGLDAAHFHASALAPWMLTDDPYFLEAIQFSINWFLLYNGYQRNNQGLPGIPYFGESRPFAWGLRDLLVAASSTPATVPSWLRPQSYYTACVGDCKTLALRYVNQTARLGAMFKTWTNTGLVSPWQTAWLNTQVGQAVALGFAGWDVIYAWCIDMQIEMSNGTSGWPRQYPIPYQLFPDSAFTTGRGYLTDTATDVTVPASWPAYWTWFKNGQGGITPTINDTGWDGHTLMQIGGSPAYYLHLRGTLSQAVNCGKSAAKSCYASLHANIPATLSGLPGGAQARFSVDPA